MTIIKGCLLAVGSAFLVEAFFDNTPEGWFACMGLSTILIVFGTILGGKNE